MEYKYGMRSRGYSIGCQPNGVIRREDSDKYWDVIVYDHKLSDEDIRHYSLDALYEESFTNDELLMLSDIIVSYKTVLAQHNITLPPFARKGLEKDIDKMRELNSKICGMIKV